MRERAGVWNPGLSAKLVPFLEVTEPPCPSGPYSLPTKVYVLGEGENLSLAVGGAWQALWVAQVPLTPLTSSLPSTLFSALLPPCLPLQSLSCVDSQTLGGDPEKHQGI